MDEVIAVSTRRWGFRRTTGMGVGILLMVIASISLSATLAAANHADGCPESEPGPANGSTVVVGTSGDDWCLVGGNGVDSVRGRGGDDRVIGTHGPDTLMGGPGDDRFWGGRGPDVFVCGPGIDRVHNERDTGSDVIDSSCEIIRQDG